MADISMCLDNSCPRRNLCARHPQAEVYAVSQRQSYQGFKLEKGQCRGWSFKLADDTPGDEIAKHVLPEVWAQLDPLIEGHRHATAAMLAVELIGCRPLVGLEDVCARRCALASAKDKSQGCHGDVQCEAPNWPQRPSRCDVPEKR